MHRVVLLGAGALVLAACGREPTKEAVRAEAEASKSAVDSHTDMGVSALNAFYKDVPRTSLPLTAPDDADESVATFLEVCSRALVDIPSAIGAAAKRGWTTGRMGTLGVAMTGSMRLERVDPSAGRSDSLYLDTSYFPFVALTECRLMIYGDNMPETFSFDTFKSLPNIRGQQDLAPAGRSDISAGTYGFVTQAGEPVWIKVSFFPSISLRMEMSIMRHTLPTP